jgi:hypothetical protein
MKNHVPTVELKEKPTALGIRPTGLKVFGGLK